MSARNKSEAKSDIEAWLKARGAEVLVPTNEWEIARFKSTEKTHVFYRSKTGVVRFSSHETRKIWLAYKEGIEIRLFEKTKSESPVKRQVEYRTLVDRDGEFCFYCGCSPSEGKALTTEHLVAKTHGGPNHISNKFIACEPCNAEAGHMSAPEKIRLRESKSTKP